MHKADKYFCDLALKDLCSAVLVKDLESRATSGMYLMLCSYRECYL